jgi:hypothetical protein
MDISELSLENVRIISQDLNQFSHLKQLAHGYEGKRAETTDTNLSRLSNLMFGILQTSPIRFDKKKYSFSSLIG